MSNSSPVLLALALSALGCTKQAVEIEVRDPGRVQVALRSGPVPAPVMLPDGGEGSLPLPGAEGRPVATRDEGTIVIEWPELARRIELVNADRLFPAAQSEESVKLSGPLLYADYDVTDRRVFEPDGAREGAIPIQLSTPLDNVVRAEHVTERRKWPAYVMLPIGSLLALAGTLVLLNTESDLERLSGALYLTAGLPLVGYSIFLMTDSPTVVPLLPGAPARADD